MPNVLAQPAVRGARVDFVTSPALDLVNAMYFTHLADEMEGLDDWPRRTRAAMSGELRAELDYLFTYPIHQAGVIGALNDLLFSTPRPPYDADGLLAFVRDLKAHTTAAREPSIQGLVLAATSWWCDAEPLPVPAGTPPRDALRLVLQHQRFPDDDSHPPMVQISLDEALAVFERPEQLRARMLALIAQFYDRHYRPDEERRAVCLGRSVEHHRDVEGRRREPLDPESLVTSLAGTHSSCLKHEAGAYDRFVFVPSLDVGPYVSTIDAPPLFAMYYACERSFRGTDEDDGERMHRAALVYKALSDEQRLRILRELRRGELYAQEIVERTGIHQSVVSRHLAFLKAVGLVNVRRQNNMKFYSLNGAMRDELRQATDAVLPASG